MVRGGEGVTQLCFFEKQCCFNIILAFQSHCMAGSELCQSLFLNYNVLFINYNKLFFTIASFYNTTWKVSINPKEIVLKCTQISNRNCCKSKKLQYFVVHTPPLWLTLHNFQSLSTEYNKGVVSFSDQRLKVVFAIVHEMTHANCKVVYCRSCDLTFSNSSMSFIIEEHGSISVSLSKNGSSRGSGGGDGGSWSPVCDDSFSFCKISVLRW